MKKFLTKAGMFIGSLAAPAIALAEGESVTPKSLPEGLDANVFLAYKDSVTEVFVQVLIGFAVIIVSLFAWRLMKKALNGSK